MAKNKSPDLEVISETESPAEKRKIMRVNLTAEQFKLDRGGKIFSVVDLSSEGMAFRILDSEDFLAFPIATIVQGTLNLHGEKLAVRARVRHLGPHGVGCEFEELHADARSVLDRFLDPARLGSELRPIPSSDPRVDWFHGSSGTDLLLTRGADGKCIRFTIYLLGTYIQWDAKKGLETGCAKASEDRIDQHPEEWGIVHFETLLLEPDLSADAKKLSVAKALILSSNISQDLKSWCAQQLSL